MLAVALLAASPALAATFSVTNTGDSGAGSLRQAIVDANTAAGSDAISFSIAGAPPFVIAPLSALPAITETVAIDGTSQPGFVAGTPVIVIDGASAGAGVTGLTLAAGATGSFLRALVVNNFSGDGIDVLAAAALVQGCWVGLDATGTAAAGNGSWGIFVAASGVSIGGTTAADRNVISGNASPGTAGVCIGSGSSSEVVGNYVGLNAAGTAAVPNGNGIAVQAAAVNSVIGGTGPGAGNVVSGNTVMGLDIYAGATIRGNLVGTNPGGTAAVPNGNGIMIRSGANGSVVGGTTAAARNVISGNSAFGLGVDATNVLVQGNYIGTDAAGTTPIFNGGWTVFMQPAGATNNLVGGTTAATANILCGNPVWVNSGTGNAILGNSYPASGRIQLGAGGTPNDSCDGDTGPNGLQNFPVLTSALVSGGNTTVTGSLDSTGGTAFRIEFYRSTGTDAPTYLGFTDVTTAASPVCTATINAILPVILAGTDSVVATATVKTATGTLFGDTSEFSAPIGVTTPVELMLYKVE
jgi:hypothetical protein